MCAQRKHERKEGRRRRSFSLIGRGAGKPSSIKKKVEVKNLLNVGNLKMKVQKFLYSTSFFGPEINAKTNHLL